MSQHSNATCSVSDAFEGCEYDSRSPHEQGRCRESESSKSEFPEHLLVFLRFPEEGRCKTRLIPIFGPEGATSIYRFLAHHTLATIRTFAATRSCQATVHFCGPSIHEVADEFGSDLEYVRQPDAPLGVKLAYAMQVAFSRGAKRVLVIGSDCPDLSCSDLNRAFDLLKTREVVLGPAHDGGYYLLGLNQVRPEMFKDIEWSTSRVLQQTITRSKQLGLSVSFTRTLADVDQPEDVVLVRRAMLRESGKRVNCTREFNLPEWNRLSVIIPTFNEGSTLSMTLKSIGKPNRDLEIIVADGGSQDDTVKIAENFGCRVLRMKAKRSTQMNAGASLSTGRNLLFLHADTLLPPDYQNQIESALEEGAAGAFQLRINSPRLGLRGVEAGVNLRSRIFKLPYGDQGIFVRAATFFEFGGYRDLQFMEDFDFVRHMRKKGEIRVAESAVITSARRWDSCGILKTTVINQLCIFAYRCGFSDSTIRRLYEGACWPRTKDE